MVPVVSFIGWHNTGKTTLVKEVVHHLKESGLRVAVIKSTKHTGIEFDQEGTDTDMYRKAGADSVTLMAPDQMIIMSSKPDNTLVGIVHRYFLDYDIVIGEGFKHERHIAKIEVVANDDSDLLRSQVTGVKAVVTDRSISGDYVFRPDESKEVAEFIIKKFVENRKADEEQALLLVNGKKIPMKGFVQDALAGTIIGFIKSLKQTGNMQEVDIKIKLPRDIP